MPRLDDVGGMVLEMIGKVASIVLAMSALGLGGCIAEERVAYVRAVPEPDASEVVEVSPGAGSVYIAGHWEWNGARYVWARAHYLQRPQPNLYWLEGHWQNSPQGWYWQAGHWVDLKAMHPHRPRPHVGPAQPPASPEAPEEPGANVPPAPTYAPPPPPANIPPPPGAVQQRYLQPSPNIGY